MVCGGERAGRGYCGGGEGRVEVGVQVAGELVDLVDEDLDGVVAADDQRVEVRQVVVDDARTAAQTLLAPLLAHRVVVRNDHLHAVCRTAEVRTEHQHVRSAAREVLRGGNRSVPQQLDVRAATLQAPLESHLVLHNQILLRHIDRLVEQCGDSIVRGGVLRDQRLVTVQSGADETVTPDPGLSSIFAVVTVQPAAVVTLEGFQEFQLTIDLRDDIFLLAMICVVLRQSLAQIVHHKSFPAQAG